MNKYLIDFSARNKKTGEVIFSLAETITSSRPLTDKELRARVSDHYSEINYFKSKEVKNGTKNSPSHR